MKTLVDKFDSVFCKVLRKHHLPVDKWWVLFDSDMFKEVEKKCQKFIKDEDSLYTYQCWIKEMEEDL